MALCDQIYAALRETFGVPEDDRFMTISEHGEDDLDYGRSYLGLPGLPRLPVVLHAREEKGRRGDAIASLSVAFKNAVAG